MSPSTANSKAKGRSVQWMMERSPEEARQIKSLMDNGEMYRELERRNLRVLSSRSGSSGQSAQSRARARSGLGEPQENMETYWRILFHNCLELGADIFLDLIALRVKGHVNNNMIDGLLNLPTVRKLGLTDVSKEACRAVLSEQIIAETMTTKDRKEARRAVRVAFESIKAEDDLLEEIVCWTSPQRSTSS